jgi:6-phosphogluconolactonase (cycloisomerase 2 family)
MKMVQVHDRLLRHLTVALTLIIVLAGVRHASAVVPSAVSVSPNSGHGINQTFTFTYSHAAGYTNLTWTFGLFTSNQEFTIVNACYFYYNVSSGVLSLADDSGSGVAGTVNLGPSPSGAAANTQCMITAAGSSAIGAGNNLTLNVAIQFFPAFAGQKNVYGRADGTGGGSSGWVQLGTWSRTLATPSNATPEVLANRVGGGSAPGIAKTFSLYYTDGQGYADMTYLLFHFSNGTVPNSCYGAYKVATNEVLLATDAGNTFVGSLTPGSGTLSNNQCTIDGTHTSVSRSGETIILDLNITFKPSFTGAKTLWMRADGSAGFSSGWIARGNWTILGNIYSYVVDTAGNNIYGFSMNPSTGVLTSLASNPMPTGSSPKALAADPVGRFLYEWGSGDSNLNGYTINNSTGALSAISSGFPISLSNVTAAAVDSWGQYLYLTTSSGIYAYSIAPGTGALTALTGSPFTSSAKKFIGIGIDPSGKYLYAAANNSKVAVFAIDRLAGGLTEISGSPYTASVGGSMIVDPTSRFLYAADSTTNKLYGYAITVSTGALTPLRGSPFRVGGDGASAITTEPTGRYLYASSGTAKIEGFSIKANTGVLTGMGTFTPAAAIDALAADPLYHYVLGTSGGDQSTLRIRKAPPGGALIEISGSPLPLGGTYGSSGNTGFAVVVTPTPTPAP